MKDVFSEMVMKWPSAVVARSEVAKFSGGLVASKSLANRASLGQSTPPAFRVGVKICYSAQDLAAWLRSRAKEV